MKASVWCEELQQLSVDEVQAAVVQAVLDGHTLPFSWQPVPVECNGHRGVLFVGSEPLRIGEDGDSVIAMVSAEAAQYIADACDVLQPTTRMMDAIYDAGLHRCQPLPLQPSDPTERVASGYSPSMSDAHAMLRFTQEVDSDVADAPGLVAMPFKAWVLTNKLTTASASKAFNYGFYDSSAPYRSASGYKMWQTLGSRHTAKHFDYSQVFIAVHPLMLVDNKWTSVKKVGNDRKLCALVSDEGVVKTWRHPSVPDESAPDTIPPPDDNQPETSELAFDRLLKLVSPYMRGNDIIRWQKFLKASPDGVFGPQTDALTRQFQASTGLIADGVVGPRTVDAANEVITALEETGSAWTIELGGVDDPSELVDDFRQAKSYTPSVRTDAIIRHIVLHTAEIAESATSAEALMNWAAGSNPPKASWHYAVDNNSITQSVKDEDVAWHAPGANKSGIGIEMSGRARQTPEEWEDDYSVDMLDRCARLVAALCVKWSIPVEFVDRDGLKDTSSRGITTHREVTYAFRKSTHTDPGAHFPMDEFIAKVRGYVHA